MCKSYRGEPSWSQNAQGAAEKFIISRITTGQSFTALDLKKSVREAVGPEDPVTQEDASRVLRKWLRDSGEATKWDARDVTRDGFTFLEYHGPVVTSVTDSTLVASTVTTQPEVTTSVVEEKTSLLSRFWKKFLG